MTPLVSGTRTTSSTPAVFHVDRAGSSKNVDPLKPVDFSKANQKTGPTLAGRKRGR